ncbi:hypothetical protein, partial [Corynebacterium bovis]|uniref:hypothetical protein n=1 Tax=Corynebacterium bovis TaxID=36808 RepID=UPI001C896A95
PRQAEKLGIVYTPVEVVDFILRAADHVLREHFGRGLTDRKVHAAGRRSPGSCSASRRSPPPSAPGCSSRAAVTSPTTGPPPRPAP